MELIGCPGPWTCSKRPVKCPRKRKCVTTRSPAAIICSILQLRSGIAARISFEAASGPATPWRRPVGSVLSTKFGARTARVTDDGTAPAIAAIAPALIKSRREVIVLLPKALPRFEEVHDCLLSVRHGKPQGTDSRAQRQSQQRI